MPLLIIIPCYNEFDRLPSQEFEDFMRLHPEIHFCFVNDASNDFTEKLISKLQVGFPANVSYHSLEYNVGKAEAIREGIKYMAERGNFKYLAFADADLSTPLNELFRLYNIIMQENLSFVFGSRVAVYGSKITRYATRHYFGRLFATFASTALDLVIYDTQCGLKIFDYQLAKTLFSNSFISRWLFDVEIFARLKQIFSEEKLPSIMREIPLYEWTEKGNSKLKVLDVLITPFFLLKIYNKYR